MSQPSTVPTQLQKTRYLVLDDRRIDEAIAAERTLVKQLVEDVACRFYNVPACARIFWNASKICCISSVSPKNMECPKLQTSLL